MKNRLYLAALACIFLLILNPIVMGGSVTDTTDLNRARLKIIEFFDGYQDTQLVFIDGSELSSEDQLFFRFFKSQTSGIDNADTIKDIEVGSYEEITWDCVVILGGVKTNSLASDVADRIDSGELVLLEEEFLDPYHLIFAEDTLLDHEVLWIYSEKELINLENQAAERSLLGLVMDRKYVPVVATLISMFLVYLWNMMGNVVVEFFSDFVSERVKEKKVKKRGIKKQTGHASLHRFLDRNELLAVVLTTVAFSFVLTWSWVEEFSGFLDLFLINLVIVGLVIGGTESLRQLWCWKKKVRSEFVFWPFGALLTLGSTFLGNTFSLSSHTAMEDEEKAKEFGKISFFISLLMYVIVVGAFIYNLIRPSVVTQMVFVFMSMNLFIDMFPMEPMDGADIRKWRKGVWAVFYVIVVVSYIGLNFTMYLQ